MACLINNRHFHLPPSGLSTSNALSHLAQSREVYSQTISQSSHFIIDSELTGQNMLARQPGASVPKLTTELFPGVIRLLSVGWGPKAIGIATTNRLC